MLYRHAKRSAIRRLTWLILVPIRWRFSTDTVPRNHGFAFFAFVKLIPVGSCLSAASDATLRQRIHKAHWDKTAWRLFKLIRRRCCPIPKGYNRLSRCCIARYVIIQSPCQVFQAADRHLRKKVVFPMIKHLIRNPGKGPALAATGHSCPGSALMCDPNGEERRQALAHKHGRSMYLQTTVAAEKTADAKGRNQQPVKHQTALPGLATLLPGDEVKINRKPRAIQQDFPQGHGRTVAFMIVRSQGVFVMLQVTERISMVRPHHKGAKAVHDCMIPVPLQAKIAVNRLVIQAQAAQKKEETGD